MRILISRYVKELALLLALAVVAPSNADSWKVTEPSTSPEEFGLTIRTTPHRTPDEERAGFHVPEGFVVELVAAEPDIVKPLNMAFDSKGRLWVTQTHHYPFPVKEGEPATDSIVVLEDQDKDGTFEKKTIFAGDLNIPMGLLPVADGVICFSIPNLLYLKDEDGDGVCDSRQVLYGPFDTTRDTHGLVNSLRDGGDGWIYACHGFNNRSVIAGTDGHQVSLPSGNVFRFRLDGSRVELYSQGQVNPFGLTQDAWSNWLSADCHSKPITQLIRGGSYQSFGRPDDGLGFAPDMMDHLHGSTAIAGLAHTVDSRFPASMENQLVSGNVMTCRINRNQVVYHGATAKAIEVSDLLTSEDPWFRPVDLVFGPDGHLYVADFYNKIIGHYEVPLDHPDRDRTSGRIWRIRWNGANTTSSSGDGTAGSQKTIVPGHRVHKKVTRWNELDALDLTKTADAMEWTASIQALSDSSATEEGLQWFLKSIPKVVGLDDPVAKQTHLIAFRRTLQNLQASDSAKLKKVLDKLFADGLSPSATDMLLKILPTCRNVDCTNYAIQLITHLSDPNGGKRPISELQWAVDRVADVVEDENMEGFLGLLGRTSPGNDPLAFADRLVAIGQRQLQSRGSVSPKLREVARKTLGNLASDLHRKLDANPTAVLPAMWIAYPTLGSNSEDRRAWGGELRQVRQEDSSGKSTVTGMTLASSFPLSEAYTGRWGTPPIPAPEVFSFSIAGHMGQPPAPANQLNFARLTLWDSETGIGEEIARAYAPRNDEAQTVHWKIPNPKGKHVIFEVVDGDAGPSYAWVAVGNFSAPELATNNYERTWNSIRALVSLVGGAEADADFVSLAASNRLTDLDRYQLGKSELQSKSPIESTLTSIAMENQHWDLVLKSLKGIGTQNDAIQAWGARWDEIAPTLFHRLSAASQGYFVRQIAKYSSSANRLWQWTTKGALPVDVLRELPKTWWDGLSEVDSKNLASAREALASRVDRSKLIAEKLEKVRSSDVDLTLGARVFADKCAQCHKLGTVGVVVGPQLEGVGNRGLERLLEDILWPDRNVDEAFRVTLLRLEDGVVLTGLVTSRGEKTLTIVDQLGKPQVVSLDDIEQEKHSELSLMPSNLEETMNVQEIASLLAYLQAAGKK